MNIDPFNEIITDPLGLHNTQDDLILTPIGFIFITDQIEQSTTEIKYKKLLIEQLESNAKYASTIKEQQLKEQQLKEQQLKEQQQKEKQLRQKRLRQKRLKEELKEQQLKEQQLKEEQFKKQKIVLINQLDINIENTSKNNNRSSYYIEFIKLYNELILVDSLNLLTFDNFETSIYKFKILFINLTDDERCITKYYYNLIIDKYSYYYKLFY